MGVAVRKSWLQDERQKYAWQSGIGEIKVSVDEVLLCCGLYYRFNFRSIFITVPFDQTKMWDALLTPGKDNSPAVHIAIWRLITRQTATIRLQTRLGMRVGIATRHTQHNRDFLSTTQSNPLPRAVMSRLMKRAGLSEYVRSDASASKIGLPTSNSHVHSSRHVDWAIALASGHVLV